LQLRKKHGKTSAGVAENYPDILVELKVTLRLYLELKRQTKIQE
jgi:hypothetical protein